MYKAEFNQRSQIKEKIKLKKSRRKLIFNGEILKEAALNSETPLFNIILELQSLQTRQEEYEAYFEKEDKTVFEDGMIL